jgi:hypothetical protein
MGTGEELVALPFESLKITDLGILYNITVQELNDLPEFGEKKK